MQRVAARWVSYTLTDEQKQPRIDAAKCLYKRYETKGDSFINRIMAIYETGIRSYEVEVKRQSSE